MISNWTGTGSPGSKLVLMGYRGTGMHFIDQKKLKRGAGVSVTAKLKMVVRDPKQDPAEEEL